MSIVRRGLATGIAAGLLVLSAPAPVVAAGAAITTAPEVVSIDAPAPGHSTSWTMSVSNTTDEVLPLGLVVAGADGPLTTGATPLAITLSSSSGAEVLAATSAGTLLGTTVPLVPLAPGETRELRGEAALPRAAGDGYQGADGRLTFRFAASIEPTTPSAPSLSRTGTELTVGAALAAALLLGGFASIITGRRRRNQHD